MLNFLTESSKDFQETKTIGSFSMGESKNSFDAMYEDAHETLMSQNIDPKIDINLMIKNPVMMESFKDALLDQLKRDCEKYEADGNPRYASLYEQTSAMFDNCLNDLVLESTRVGQLLPIKAVDFPVLIKQNLALAAKDIMQTEVTKTPVVKKHLERRWIIVDKQTNERYEYPQCFFKPDVVKKIWGAGKGLPIKDTPVSIANGACFNYNIPEKLSDSTDPTREKITIDLRIVKVMFDEDINADASTPGTGGAGGTGGTTEGGGSAGTGTTTKPVIKELPVEMRINLSDSTWLGGTIKHPETGEVIDVVTGTVDFINNTVSLSAAAGKVTKVVFAGYLSNELNERAVTFDRTREEFEWKIEDGFRADISYSLEELQDAKALMDMDLYKLTYNDLADTLIQMEDNGILTYLDEQYDKYKGVELDPLGFNPFIREQVFDCDSSTQTTALQVEYIQKMLKFYVDNFLISICDTAKMEDLTFVVYGNPRYISLLDPNVNWVVKAGDHIGGVKMNYNYGIMNACGMKIQVVSTMKYDHKNNRKLRFIPYPLSDDQFTFKHYKYTTHILTAQNSGYRDPNKPGGSMTYLMGTSRNTTATIQGIQGSMSFENTPFILTQ